MTNKKEHTTRFKINNSLFYFTLFILFIFFFSFSVIVFAETDPNIDNMPKKSAMLYPLPESIDIGKEIEFDLIINPFLEGVHEDLQKVNNYVFEMTFDPNVLKLQFVENSLETFDVKQTGSTGKIKVIAIGIDPAADVFNFEPTKLLKFKFLAVGKSENAPVKISKMYLMNSLGAGGTEAELITDLFDGKIAVLENGLNTFIDEYYADDTLYGYGSRSKYWNLSEHEKDEVLNAWDGLSPAEKAKYGQCVPNCNSKECGTDGCGGFCGTTNGLCLNGNECFDFKCSCQPNCFGKVCGDNSCGGLCSDRKCTKYDEHRIPGQIWSKWYTYLLLILALVILVGSLIVAEKDKIKEKYHVWLLKRHQAKIMNQSTKMDQGQFRKQSQQTQQIQQQAQQSKASSQLISFIMNQLNKGYNREQIEQSLLRVGWKKEMIDDAFRNINI
jgi:hypothetical protein